MDVSSSGFIDVGSRRSLGLPAKANSTGVVPRKVIWVFLTIVALHINWARVICARVVLSRFFESVCGPVGHSLKCLCVVEDGGKPYRHKLPSGSSGTCPSNHEAWQ